MSLLLRVLGVLMLALLFACAHEHEAPGPAAGAASPSTGGTLPPWLPDALRSAPIEVALTFDEMVCK